MAICVAGEEKILLKVKSLKSRKKYKNIKNIIKKQEYWGKILKKAAKYGSLWYNNYNCHFAHYAERI